MTFFGLVWFLFVLWCFIKKDIKYMLFATLLFMAFQSCNVIYLGGSGIGPGILTSLLFVVKTFVHRGGRFYYYKRDRLILLIAFLLIGIVIFSSSRNGIIGNNFVLILQLLGYILCFTCINFIKNELDKDVVYHIVRTIIIFLGIMGIVQFLTTTEILPLRSVLNLLFYNDPDTNVLFHKYNYSRIMSTYMEPSYFAGFVVGAFYYLLSIRDKWKQNSWIIILLAVETIMTKSSTAYGAFFAIGIVFILFAKNIGIEWKIMGVVLAALGFCIVYFGFYNILEAVIFSKESTGSFITRIRWNNEAMQAFKSSIIYGVGYKNCRGSSIVYSLLGQLGCIGFALYVMFNLVIILPLFKNKKIGYLDDIYSNGIRYAVLSAVVCQIIACPDLDLCTYWFWLYCEGTIIFISKSKSNQKSQHLIENLQE